MCASCREWAPPTSCEFFEMCIDFGKVQVEGLITEKISYEISKSSDFAKNFRISRKISRFHGDFKISRKISGFPERLCKVSRFQWRFLQDFQILVQILTYWFWISGWCDYLLHTCRMTQCAGRNLHSSIHYIHCNNMLVVLTTEWLPWLQMNCRDCGYERFALMLNTNCNPPKAAAQFILQPQYTNNPQDICERVTCLH